MVLPKEPVSTLPGTGATGNWIYGNFVGTDPAGIGAHTNGFGVRLLGATEQPCRVTDGIGNLITDTSGRASPWSGVTTVGNQISANRIFANDASPNPPLSEMLQFDGSSYVRLPQDLSGDPVEGLVPDQQ